MTYIVLFEDASDADPDLRRRHMTAHKTFLAEAGVVRAAGPLRDVAGPAGGLWIVDVDTEDAVDALIKNDPFFPTGLRKSWRILSWTQVFTRD